MGSTKYGQTFNWMRIVACDWSDVPLGRYSATGSAEDSRCASGRSNDPRVLHDRFGHCEEDPVQRARDSAVPLWRTHGSCACAETIATTVVFVYKADRRSLNDH